MYRGMSIPSVLQIVDNPGPPSLLKTRNRTRNSFRPKYRKILSGAVSEAVSGEWSPKALTMGRVTTSAQKRIAPAEWVAPAGRDCAGASPGPSLVSTLFGRCPYGANGTAAPRPPAQIQGFRWAVFSSLREAAGCQKCQPKNNA